MVRDFYKALEASEESVFKAAQWLRRDKNVTVRIPRKKDVPDSGDARDEGDIIAYVERIVEVKEKPNFNFTCKEDFPYETIMVSNVESADRHVVHMWIIVSGNKTHAAIISGKSKAYFIKKNVFCPNTEKMELKYMCPTEHVEFVKL
jgi:hypothetical protein